MYCSSCGNQLSEDTRFCDRCGKPVVKITTDDREQSGNTGGSNTPVTDQSLVSSGRDWVETGAAVFQEFTDSARDAADNLGLDKCQRIAAIIAACSLFLFVICITGTLASWLSAISGAMLLIFCLRKKKFDSVELALTMTVFIMRFVTVDIRVLFGTDIYYPAASIIMRFVFYGLAVIYWLAVTGRFSKPYK